MLKGGMSGRPLVLLKWPLTLDINFFINFSCYGTLAMRIKNLTTEIMYFHQSSMGHIFIVVAAGFPSRSTPSGGHPQAGLSAALRVAALRAATDSKFTINSYF